MTQKPKPSLHALRRELLLAAVVLLFTHNKKKFKKVSAESWTLNSEFRERNRQQAAQFWSQLSGQEPELFPFTTDAVAATYMNLRKKPERQKKLYKKVSAGKEPKLGYDRMYDPVMLAKAVLHVYQQNANDSTISGTGENSDDWTRVDTFRNDLYRRVREAWVIETKSKVFIDYFPWTLDEVVLIYVRIRKYGPAQVKVWEQELKGDKP